MSMKALFAGTVILACLCAGAARADEQYDQCIDKSDGSNQAWGQCGSDWIKREDKRLNDTWSALMTALKPKDGPESFAKTRSDLLQEQRGWIAFKDKACLFYANGDSGREGSVLGFPSCRAALIAGRTKELEGYLKDFQPK